MQVAGADLSKGPSWSAAHCAICGWSINVDNDSGKWLVDRHMENHMKWGLKMATSCAKNGMHAFDVETQTCRLCGWKPELEKSHAMDAE